MKKINISIITAVLLCMITVFAGCNDKVDSKVENNDNSYGVFLDCDASNMPRNITSYKTIVIDAQNFEDSDINKLKAQGCTVYSYLNVGSLENFRPYYKRFENLILSKYDNWEEEFWVDVSDEQWQDFIVQTVATETASKGVNGFFIDNTDVYYHYKTDNIYEGLNNMMSGLKKLGLPVIINGGDVYMQRLIKENRQGLIDGINQECVFSKISDYEKDEFGKNIETTRQYYIDYLQSCKEKGLAVYLIEYTVDRALIEDIVSYCRNNGFKYYISDTVNL